MTWRVLLAALLTGGCADRAAPAPQRPPQTVAGFERSTEPETGRTGTVTGYEFTQAGPILATVDVRLPSATPSLLPSLDTRRDADPALSAALLARSKAQVARYYPAAKTVDEGEAFVLLNGRLQPGRHARLVFDDIFAGREQPIALDITTVCCDSAGRSYEYRFRFPANLADEQPVAEFKRVFRLN